MDVFIEIIHETTNRPSRPVAAIEEFDLEPLEESFHRGVVGRTALLRYGARDSASLATLFGASAMGTGRWHATSTRKVFFMPRVKGSAARVPELPYHRGGALVVLDEQFDGF